MIVVVHADDDSKKMLSDPGSLPPDGEANDVFGAAVALSADTALIWCSLKDVASNVDQGHAYISTLERTDVSASVSSPKTVSRGIVGLSSGLPPYL